ncbi:MAG: preprotein translocase subunit SecG [Oscillospiraceae bacterium]|jgi:preprotein translocase subunit SecG
MSGISLVITIIHVLCCVLLTLMILFQSGKRSGLSGAIAGAAETFMSKNKARTLDAKLAKATKYVAIVFAVLTIVMNIIV